MLNSNEIYEIFESAIRDYHLQNEIDGECENPHLIFNIEGQLYHKSIIDTRQWHCEDEVRNPQLEAEQVRYFKNKIDGLNQERTNCVEYIDDLIWLFNQEIKPNNDARLVTESPAWVIDRLSILALKIYHMRIETERTDISEEIKLSYNQKLSLLETQKLDLCLALDNLFFEIKNGTSIYKLYRQVKMYNDTDLNPVLRKNQ